MKRHLSQLGLAICTTMCGLTGSAYASPGAGSPPVPEFLASHDIGSAAIKVQMVDDDVLANQTGKYAGATMISGFVLNVLSQLQLPNGANVLAQGTLSAVQNAAGQRLGVGRLDARCAEFRGGRAVSLYLLTCQRNEVERA